MKDEGGESWLPYPEGPSTDHFRHIWVIQRRACMHAPAFIGAPIPHRRPGETERAAMITMTYFHPWTLRAADELDGHVDEQQSVVPYAGNLRPQDATWEVTLSMWLDGNVVSQESARYVHNFLSVFRVRPRDQDEDVRSDEDVDDEELILTTSDLNQALKTRIGGQHTEGETKQERRRGVKRRMKRILVKA